MLTQRISLGGSEMGPESGGSSEVTRTIWWLVVMIIVLPLAGGTVADSCNWSGSGLDFPVSSGDSSPRVVRPVYLHCSQGLVRWTYPSGGLRIQFQPRHRAKPNGLSRELWNSIAPSGEFRVCIKVAEEFSGARIYLEGHRKLLLMHAGHDDSRPFRLKRCFTSVHGKAALYVEGQKSDPPAKGPWRKEATFSYDLKALSHEEYEDDQTECRPCTKEELIDQFCSSEFVIKGHLMSLHHDQAMETTELDIKVSRVLREPNLGGLSRVELGRTLLQRPLKCGTKFGSEEFLFMGRTVLGDSVVTCVPRWKDWKITRNEAQLEGLNPCLLEN